MSRPFLENNLSLAYPFVDIAEAPAVGVIADAMVASPQAGPYTLTSFSPGFDGLLADPLANAVIQVTSPDGIALNTTSAVSTPLGAGYRSVEAVDPTRGSRVRLIVSSAVATLGPLPVPLEFVSAVGVRLDSGLTSLQGLSGDVVLDFTDYATLTPQGNGAVLAFADPIDRVACPPCDGVFSLAQAVADVFGSLSIDATECYALVPDLSTPNRLVLHNFCTPCTDCEDVATAHDKLMRQADYYYKLSAIHHQQFNRYQRSVAAANAVIAAVQGIADVNIPEGTVSLVDRVINRPYFSQLYLAIVNNTTRPISVELTVTVTPAGLAAQLTPQPNSFLVQRTLSGGVPFTGFAGFPGGPYTFAIDPQDSVGLNSEAKRSIINDAFTTGQWVVNAVITFGGPAPVPPPAVISKPLTPDIALFGAPVTEIP
jgi:hypothetical protein